LFAHPLIKKKERSKIIPFLNPFKFIKIAKSFKAYIYTHQHRKKNDSGLILGGLLSIFPKYINLLVLR